MYSFFWACDALLGRLCSPQGYPETLTSLQIVQWEADLALQALTYITNTATHENEHIQKIFSQYMMSLDMSHGEKVI